MREQTTVLVGKNNTGKTSFAVLLEKFLYKKKQSFCFDDFPLSLRSTITSIDQSTDIHQCSIRLIFKISYNEADNLNEVSEFMLDLDPDKRHVNILMECEIDKDRLLKSLPDESAKKKAFIEKNLGSKFLKIGYYAFNNIGSDGEVAFSKIPRNQFVEKSLKEVSALLNLQVIHARRHVASSEDIGRNSNPLSIISNKFFKRINEGVDAGLTPSEESKIEQEQIFDGLRTKLAEIDASLGGHYEQVFGNFLKNSGDFLSLNGLKVISNIQSQTLIERSSKVIYGDSDNHLPENYSGLGYLNILYLLLQLEFIKEEFLSRSTPIKLLMIEEPEAHTHPQMQYVFADKIESLIQNTPNLQAILTTHSSHVISKSKFVDLRYLKKDHDFEGVELKNFHTDLYAKYKKMGDDGEGLFKFLQQYLTLHSAELFFASKVIFIEGVTERILFPWFIREFDKNLKENQQPLSSQNITVLEVGANAKAFAPFMEFIGVKTLIITDIDTTIFKPAEEGKKAKYKAHKVKGASHTSNASISHFLNAPDDMHSDEYVGWHAKLISGTQSMDNELLFIAYQLEENGYHARSFEDAFVSLNLPTILAKAQAKTLRGLKNISKLESFAASTDDIYDLTKDILGKKSDFAASVLYSILTQDSEWSVPKYIMDGLQWLHQD